MSVLSESSDSSSDSAGDDVKPAESSERDGRRKVELEPAKQVPENIKGVLWPERVKDALGEAKDFGKFRERRTFRFLHLFSGPDDRLAVALVEEGKKAGLSVKVESVDIKKDPAMDLRRNEIMDKIEAKVSEGQYDGYHAGFPCGSFSRVRWVQRAGMPPPVRSRQFPYGLPGNSQAQQGTSGSHCGKSPRRRRWSSRKCMDVAGDCGGTRTDGGQHGGLQHVPLHGRQGEVLQARQMGG